MSTVLRQESELHAALLVMSYEAQDKRDISIQQKVHKTDLPKN